jgi:LmbE family N-acetylglucosaminyl deacetylase
MPADLITVGAHMADEVAWGMALAAHKRQGASIGMVHLTPGEKGHPTMEPDQYARQKHEEAQACAEVLGAEIWTLDYKDGELPCSDKVKFELATILRNAEPKSLITHWHGSMHKDHTNTSKLFPDANFYSALKGFKLEGQHHWVRGVFCGENWEDLDGYVPEIWLEVTQEDLDLWEKAMRCYALFRGEWDTFPYLDYYRSLARTRGCEIGCEYAVTLCHPPGQKKQKRTSLFS